MLQGDTTDTELGGVPAPDQKTPPVSYGTINKSLHVAQIFPFLKSEAIHIQLSVLGLRETKERQLNIVSGKRNDQCYCYYY